MNLSIRSRAAALVLLGLALTVGVANAASVTLGGYTFDSTAFPTSAAFVSGGPATFSFSTTGTVNGDILKSVDSDLTSYMFGTPIDFRTTFGNGAIQNGTGADFVIFELGTPDDVSVIINGITKTYLTAFTGSVAAGFNLNAIAIDLTDFGIAANGTASTIEINNSSPVTGSSSIDAIGALNTATPEPAVWTLLVGGLGAIALLRRRITGLR